MTTTRSRYHLGRGTRRLACALAAVASCARAASGARPEPPALLSQTGLYADALAHNVAPENLPYTPQYPLWSDGADKQRWIHLPHGAAIEATRGEWVFPVGTKLWKEFSFGRRVETRYMERSPDGSWIYAAYAWDREERDATRAPAAGIRGAAVIAPGVRHDIPSVADCRACHEGRASQVLGLDALQLSPDRDPLAPHVRPPAPSDLVLPELARRGLIRGLDPQLLARPPRIVARTPRERAVLGYLHGNCGSCHGARSAIDGVGLVLEHDLAARSAAAEPALRTTVGQPSRFQIPGTAPGSAQRVAPGAPDTSALTFRMRTRSPLSQMPPLGTRLPDEEALRLLEGWIREDLRAAEGSVLGIEASGRTETRLPDHTKKEEGG